MDRFQNGCSRSVLRGPISKSSVRPSILHSINVKINKPYITPSHGGLRRAYFPTHQTSDLLAIYFSFAHAFALHSCLHVCLYIVSVCCSCVTHSPLSTVVMVTVALPLYTICSVLGLRTRQSTYACFQPYYFGQFVVWLLISFNSFAGLYYKLELKCTSFSVNNR